MDLKPLNLTKPLNENNKPDALTDNQTLLINTDNVAPTLLQRRTRLEIEVSKLVALLPVIPLDLAMVTNQSEGNGRNTV